MNELLCRLGFHDLKHISPTKAYCFRSKRCRGRLHRTTHNDLKDMK